jgi:transposase
VVEIADVVGCARSHVYRSIARFADGGREGLLDRRRHNGSVLANQRFRQTVASLLWQSPLDYDYPRPTWTRELLVRVAEEQTGIRVSVCTMGRVLRRMGARRGRPKPVVQCPLSDRQRRRRLRAIETLVARLPDNHVATCSRPA